LKNKDERGHTVFMGNYSISNPLYEDLIKKNIQATGIVKKNTQECLLRDPKEKSKTL